MDKNSRRAVIAGNWKMNKTPTEAKALLAAAHPELTYSGGPDKWFGEAERDESGRVGAVEVCGTPLRGAESEAAHGGAGRETREPPENTGAVCGRRGRRRVGYRRGQELPAGAIRRGHILYYNERKLTEDKTVWRRAIWIRIF